MIRHKYLRGKSLTVSEKFASAKTLLLDQNGIVADEDLTAENKVELLKHPDFEAVSPSSAKEVKKPPVAPPAEIDPDKKPLSDDSGKESGDEGKPDNSGKDEQPNKSVGATTNDEGPKEGDTKVEDGKAYIFKKNAADRLTWMRDPANDPE